MPTDRDELAERVSQVAREAVAQGRPAAWFDIVYRNAGGDAGAIPWANLEPSAGLAGWLAQAEPAQGSAVVVGCGLGDDAEAVAAAGRRVVAFDISQTAIDWCRRRFPDSQVEYVRADLFDHPAAWRQRFALVVESQTVQALPPADRPAVTAAIAGLVAPGGALWVFQRLWEAAADPQGPPWPLRRSDLELFTAAGLRETRFELWERPRDPAVAQFAAEFRR